MSVWTELVTRSNVIANLANLGPALDRARDRKDLSTEDYEGIERIRTVLTFIGKRLDAADGNLLLANQLQAVAGPIATATTHVTNFADDANSDHLLQAHAAVDSALNGFAMLVLPTKTSDLRGLREAAESYREAMVAQVKSYEGQVTDATDDVVALEKRLGELGAAIKTEKERLDGDVAAIAANATARHDAISDKYDALEEDLEQQTAGEVNSLKKRFDEAQDALVKEHAELLETEREASENLRNSYDDKLSALEDHFKAQLKQQHDLHEAAYTRLETDYEARARAIVEQMDASLTRAKKVMG